MEWTVQLPLMVQLGKKSKFILNLNHYRNAHYQTLNKAKVLFKEQILPLIKHIPPLAKCSLQYVYYPPSVREVDISNVCSVVDKFFSDAFVESGKLPDDNYKYLNEVNYLFGEVDPRNPRVEVIITQKELNPMKLIIDAPELQAAVASHLNEKYNIDVDSSQVDLGDVAEILIVIDPTGAVSKDVGAETPKKTRTRVKPTEKANAVEVAATPVEATNQIDNSPSGTRTVDTNDVTQDLVDETPTEEVAEEPTEMVDSTPTEMAEPSETVAPAIDVPRGKSIFD